MGGTAGCPAVSEQASACVCKRAQVGERVREQITEYRYRYRYSTSVRGCVLWSGWLTACQPVNQSVSQSFNLSVCLSLCPGPARAPRGKMSSVQGRRAGGRAGRQGRQGRQGRA